MWHVELIHSELFRQEQEKIFEGHVVGACYDEDLTLHDSYTLKVHILILESSSSKVVILKSILGRNRLLSMGFADISVCGRCCDP